MEHCYSIVFSWMMQNLEVRLQSPLFWGHTGIVIPGTQIPRWFSKQNVGNSISMNLSTVMEDPNWIGVACCAVFVAHADSGVGHDWLPCDWPNIGYGFQNDQVGGGLGGVYYNVPIHFQTDLVTVELDHLLIMFFTRELLIHHVSRFSIRKQDLDTMEFAFSVHKPPGLHLEVRNCGYRWIFKDDLQQLKSNMMSSGNSSSGKHKLLTSD